MELIEPIVTPPPPRGGSFIVVEIARSDFYSIEGSGTCVIL